MEILEVKNLKFSYTNTPILDDVAFSLDKGECLGLLGSNGSGKTTLINCVLGELNYHGEVYLKQEKLKKDNTEQKKIVGVIPDDNILLDYLTLYEYLSFVGKTYGMEQEDADKTIDYWIDRFQLTDAKFRIIKYFSHGMKKKAQIIAAVMANPQLLIIDEPTNGLDVETIYSFKKILRELKEKGISTLVCTHILEFAEKVCDNVVILHKTKMSEKISLVDNEEDLETVFMRYIGVEEL